MKETPTPIGPADRQRAKAEALCGNSIDEWLNPAIDGSEGGCFATRFARSVIPRRNPAEFRLVCLSVCLFIVGAGEWVKGRNQAAPHPLFLFLFLFLFTCTHHPRTFSIHDKPREDLRVD